MKKRIHLGEKKLKIYSSEIDFKEKGMNFLSEEPDEQNKGNTNSIIRKKNTIEEVKKEEDTKVDDKKVKGNIQFFKNEIWK